jgi:hypothetical protein
LQSSATSSSAASGDDGLIVLGLVAGQSQEDVVEAGPAHLQVHDGDGLRIEVSHEAGKLAGPIA